MPHQNPSPEPSSAEFAGRRQSAFREVNEEIASLTDGLVWTSHRLFVCECADLNCAESLEITEAEYGALRADGARFAVVPGHELPEVERVVLANDRFLVVEKLGAAVEVAHAGHGRAL